MVLCEEVSRMLYSIVSRPVEQTPLWMFRYSPKLSEKGYGQQG